jgi:GNAT superfamily N-acetyltransferase
MILLSRLAVDRAYVGRGLGKHLLLDVFRRAEAAAQQIGGRGLIAHAKDENASRFYLGWKFQRMPGDPLLVAIAFEVVRASLEAARQKTA